jgi:2-haloacid dehalogenase
MSGNPAPMTFDVFGTIVDWRTGLEASCTSVGRPLRESEFDRVIDVQGELERGEFLDYAEITRRSLVDVIGLSDAAAAEIGAGIGHWPLYADAAVVAALMKIAPCCAMTNSDRAHGEDTQAQLGFRLNDWLCAEDMRVYKPNPAFWHQMARRRDMRLGRDWWHVSAYADYDLAVANKLGLTTVFVERPHARPGPATYSVSDLRDLLTMLS